MKNSVKILLLISLLFVPLLAYAQTFDSNLYFGLSNNSDVGKLQEFLTDQSVYSGPITGNFFSLTLAAVKKFQLQNNIAPAAGFFGPLTRAKVNEVLSVQLNASNQQAVIETGIATPTTTQSPTTDNNQQLTQNLQNQILALQQQLVQMQQQNQIIQNQQTQIQNLQNQISSIQQQVSQSTQNNQTVSNPPVNNVVPQPIIPALKPSFIESDFNIMRVASGEEEVDLINKWSKEKWTNEQHNPIPIGIPQSVSVKPSISPEANNKYISMEYNWYLELNGVNVLTRKNCLMLEIDPIMNSDSQYHFKLEPMTKYDYVITHTELGREKSEIKGTFTTGTKKWLIDHRFVE